MYEVTLVSHERRKKVEALLPPFVLGRQQDPQYPELTLDDPFASRRQIEVVEREGGQLLIKNVGQAEVLLADGGVLSEGHELLATCPVGLRVGRTRVQISRMDSRLSFVPRHATHGWNVQAAGLSLGLARLSRTNVRPSGAATYPSAADSPAVQTGAGREDQSNPRPNSAVETLEHLTHERLIAWFEGLNALQAGVCDRKSLFQQAAASVVELIGLDHCVAIELSEAPASTNGARVVAEYGIQPTNAPAFSHTVLREVLRSRQTVFDNALDVSQAASLVNVTAFVGAPIFNEQGLVEACLFGARHVSHENQTGVLPIEAQLVQVIAGILSARLARMEIEAQQVRTRVQLEQFASPQLVREMESNPTWLEAHSRELSLLFGDIRNFSAISEQLPADQTFVLVREIMDCLTEIIHRHGGFIFNFAGDGIAAMWNAPELVSRHADSACSAAMEIQDQIDSAVSHWSDRLGQPIRVGLGIHTGTALVGNSGSRHRLKYSPIGHAVNLASRLEGATKHFGVATLISRATRDRLSSACYSCRDLGEIQVIGIAEATRVFSLQTAPPPSDWKLYESALRAFEADDCDEALVHITTWLARHPDDTPAKILKQRIEQPQESSGPWELPTK